MKSLMKRKLAISQLVQTEFVFQIKAGLGSEADFVAGSSDSDFVLRV